MTKSRIKKKWYMPNGWHTPRGIYRKLKEKEKEINRGYLREKKNRLKRTYKNIDEKE